MKTTKTRYQQMVADASPRSPVAKDCLLAFLTGGLLCALGQGLVNGYGALGLQMPTARTLCSVSLIFLSALLTALGVFDKIAKFAGAGTLVPITGFANAIAAPAIEFKSEGLVAGLGAKMFVIAGPVLVYGIAASAAYGVLLFALSLL